MTVRTETIEYRNYRIDVVEWCGFWQLRLLPLASDLRCPTDGQIVDATAPSLEAALTKVKWLIDEVLQEGRPPSADQPLPRPIPASC